MNIFATIFLAAIAMTNASPVRTMAELYAIPEFSNASAPTNPIIAKRIGFDCTGMVTFIWSNRIFFLDDGTGRAKIRSNEETTVRPGDIVRVTGTAKTSHYVKTTLFAKSVIRIGKSSPPKPIDATMEQIMRGECDLSPIRITGIVRDAFKDEIDPDWNHLVLNCGSHIIYASFPDSGISNDKLVSLIDAKISVSGICMPSGAGKRVFMGRNVVALSYSDITVLEPAPADPFTAPLLPDMRYVQPDSMLRMKRHRAIGAVIAAWDKNKFLIETKDHQFLRIELMPGKRPPACGDGVEVVGVLDTDLYHINLFRALYRPARVTVRTRKPCSVTPAQILNTPNRQTKIKTEFYGLTIRIRGTISHIPSPESGSERLNLECDGYLVPVETSGCPECMNGLMTGMEIEVTGICLFIAENYRQAAAFPPIKEFMVVVRRPDDVKILSRPSWWTTERLLTVIITLLTIMGGIFIWNRMLNRIVERRTRELTKERFARASADLKVEERTRLAVELHDTLAQNLTGISLQIDAAQMAAEEDPNSVRPYLEATRRKMQNCRENLRNCLWDLRSRAFEEKELAEAIRKTLAPHAGNATVQIDMSIPCRKLSDNTIHAVLCMIRELAVNAVHHGSAAHINVSGALEESGLAFTVTDDGIGFDPATRPGTSKGHFGLQGIAERAHRLGGQFTIDSAPGRGTIAKLTHITPKS